ncbi:hypothetical protein HYSC106933_09525 [Hydrogenibacillus schlegelii]
MFPRSEKIDPMRRPGDETGEAVSRDPIQKLHIAQTVVEPVTEGTVEDHPPGAEALRLTVGEFRVRLIFFRRQDEARHAGRPKPLKPRLTGGVEIADGAIERKSPLEEPERPFVGADHPEPPAVRP